MAGLPLCEDKVLLGPGLPVAVNALLQLAGAASQEDEDRAERLFKQARQLDGHCLQTYLALYQFYFSRARFADAETVIPAALEEAAGQGRFAADYKHPVREKWTLYGNDAAHFYSYSLKALAFIRLRSGQPIEARIILTCMHDPDPTDESGVSVLNDLTSALAATRS